MILSVYQSGCFRCVRPNLRPINVGLGSQLGDLWQLFHGRIPCGNRYAGSLWRLPKNASPVILAAILPLLCGCQRATEPVAEKPADLPVPAAVVVEQKPQLPEKYVGVWSGLNAQEDFEDDITLMRYFWLRLRKDGTGSLTTDMGGAHMDYVRSEKPLSWAGNDDGGIEITLEGDEKPSIAATIGDVRLIVRYADGRFPESEYVKKPAVPTKAGGL